MALNDRRITESGVRLHGVQSAPDRLIGNAQENKKVFDNYILTVLQGLMNGLIDDLTAKTTGKSGAAQIGIETLEGINGSTVLEALVSLKTQLDSKAAALETETELNQKADKATVAELVKSVSFDAASGIFTVTKEDGSFEEIDTALEKVTTNFRYDEETQALVLTLADGSEQRISLSAFITEAEFEDSEQLKFSVSGHKVTATVKSGSITETMLSSALLNKLMEQGSSASGSATAAAESAANAGLSASAAKQSAEEAKKDASTSAAAATEAAQSAKDATAAKKAVEDMGFAAQSIPAEDPASIRKETVNGKLNITLYVPRGQKGDAFTYEDFTEAQLKELTGPPGRDGLMGASVDGEKLKLSFSEGGGTAYRIGDGLKLDTETNTISVDTADEVEQDNTRPVTSAAVATTVGNIEAILATI